jgi:hypothetical protein
MEIKCWHRFPFANTCGLMNSFNEVVCSFPAVESVNGEYETSPPGFILHRFHGYSYLLTKYLPNWFQKVWFLKPIFSLLHLNSIFWAELFCNVFQMVAFLFENFNLIVHAPCDSAKDSTLSDQLRRWHLVSIIHKKLTRKPMKITVQFIIICGNQITLI